jgi:hypothetical protein
MDPRWKEQKLKRYNEEVIHLIERDLYPIITGDDKIIVKLNAVDDDSNDYKDKTGVHFMDEPTLIIGDKDNNALLVFERGEVQAKHITKHITKNMHIINKFCFDLDSIIHKRHEIAPMPVHLKSVIINNYINYNPIINNFQSCTLSNISVDFFERNYKRGGMYPLEDMKRHPEWIPEYRKQVEVKRIDMCKSCGQKFVKGCCINYNPKNRSMKTMVIGWHHE